MKSANRNHMGRIAELPCSLCGSPGPSQVHHLREGMGMAQRNSDWITIPLCHDCHQGQDGIHGTRNLWNIYKKSELDCLADTIRRLTHD